MRQHSDADTWYNRERLEELREAYVEIIAHMEPTIFLTFNFGYNIKPMNALDRLKGFCAKVERASLGRNWHKFRDPDRLRLVAFPERLDSNPHWHGVAHAPSAMIHTLASKAEAIWLSYARRGQLDYSWIEDEHAVAHYITKRIMQASSLENVAVYGPNQPI